MLLVAVLSHICIEWIDSVINMLLRFVWQTVISQLARADETHNSFDSLFEPTVQNLIFSQWTLAHRRGIGLTGDEWESKSFPHVWASPYVCRTLRQQRENSVSWRPVNWPFCQETGSSAHLDKRGEQQQRVFKLTVLSAQPQSALTPFSKTAQPRALFTRW